MYSFSKFFNFDINESILEFRNLYIFISLILLLFSNNEILDKLISLKDIFSNFDNFDIIE